ncbi:MAG: hypothetical protein K2J91_00760, partial [Lachnospiraceae bacterium]|nr:hypothetical protein [Lachnospiraceae bacterium]
NEQSLEMSKFAVWKTSKNNIQFSGLAHFIPWSRLVATERVPKMNYLLHQIVLRSTILEVIRKAVDTNCPSYILISEYIRHWMGIITG